MCFIEHELSFSSEREQLAQVSATDTVSKPAAEAVESDKLGRKITDNPFQAASVVRIACPQAPLDGIFGVTLEGQALNADEGFPVSTIAKPQLPQKAAVEPHMDEVGLKRFRSDVAVRGPPQSSPLMSNMGTAAVHPSRLQQIASDFTVSVPEFVPAAPATSSNKMEGHKRLDPDAIARLMEFNPPSVPNLPEPASANLANPPSTNLQSSRSRVWSSNKRGNGAKLQPVCNTCGGYHATHNCKKPSKPPAHSKLCGICGQHHGRKITGLARQHYVQEAVGIVTKKASPEVFADLPAIVSAVHRPSGGVAASASGGGSSSAFFGGASSISGYGMQSTYSNGPPQPHSLSQSLARIIRNGGPEILHNMADIANAMYAEESQQGDTSSGPVHIKQEPDMGYDDWHYTEGSYFKRQRTGGF